MDLGGRGENVEKERMEHAPGIMISVSKKEPEAGFFRDLGLWCETRTPWPRILFLLWAVFVGFEFFKDPGYVSIIYWLDFGIHEMGHVLTRPFLPHFIYVAAGTLVQIGVPIGAIIMFRRQDDLFAAYPFCAIWIATNLYYTSWYVADARSGFIPSAPIFGEPTTSDWAYMLGRLKIMDWDKGIATALQVLAFPLMWGGIGLGTWMVYRMIRAEKF